MKRTFYLQALMLLLCNQTALFAQEKEKETTLDEVVVTATRASVNKNSVPMTISVVSRAEIDESSESALLPALSERVPGMFVTQRGITGFGVAAGGTGGISLRGVGGSPTTQLLVLIDGHPQYMGIMGHPLPDTYMASDVEKVEVIRGPASILYGSNAMGGAINIITRKQNEEGWNLSGRTMFGSYNTQKYMFNSGLKEGNLNAYLSVNHDRTDGHRPNSKFSITNGYAKLGYRLNKHFNLWGDANLASYTSHNPGTVSRPLTDNVADIFRGVTSLTAENNFGKMSGAFKFFYNFGQHTINDGFAAGEMPKNYFFRSEDHNYGITFYQSLCLFDGNLITAGFDYKNFGGRAWNDFVDATPDIELLHAMSLYELAGYMLVQQTLFDKVTLNVGLRLENSEKFGAEWVPQAGFSYLPLPNTVLKASVSKGFRSPTIREMYMFPPQNPDLLPERMINHEATIEQLFFSGSLTAELTGYIANGSNLIKTQMVNGSPKNLNSGDFSNKGIELAIQWFIRKNFDIKGTYSYVNLKKPVLYVPEQQATFAVSYRLKKWSLSANSQYIHCLNVNLENTVTESYFLLNAKIAYRPLKQLDIFLKGENLTNKTYQIVYQYPMPGRTVFGGFALNFSK